MIKGLKILPFMFINMSVSRCFRKFYSPLFQGKHWYAQVVIHPDKVFRKISVAFIIEGCKMRTVVKRRCKKCGIHKISQSKRHRDCKFGNASVLSSSVREKAFFLNNICDLCL